MSYDKNTQSRVLALERNLVQICLVLIFPMKVFELLHLITSWERKAMETRGKKRVCKQRICSEFIQKNHRLPERVLPRSKILIDMMQRSPKSKVGPRRREGFIAIMHSLKRAREIRLSKVKPGKRSSPTFRPGKRDSHLTVACSIVGASVNWITQDESSRMMSTSKRW